MDSPAAVETDALINESRVGRLQILVAVLGGCALLVEGFDTSVIGYIAPQLTRAWHVPPSTLGTILTADMVGLLLGYLFVSPLSARFGHKRMVVFSTAAFGALTFLTITSGDVAMLIGFRFLTGIGVGGAMPSAVALTGEYFPERMRSTSVTLIYIGFSLGQIAAGVVANLLLDSFGWQAVLAFGGAGTLLLSALFLFMLPESLEYLINRGDDRARAITILARLAPGLTISRDTRLIAGQQGARHVAVGQLVEDGRALGTGLIWIGMFMNLMVYFFLQKWLTQLLVNVGLPQQTAITATTVGLAGGIVAAIIIGPLMDRIGPYIVVAGLFAMAAVSVAVMGEVLASPAPVVIVAVSLFMGFCLSGGQKANNALSVYFYPTALRGTGLGWSLGVGRIGGVIGPFAAGILLTAGWSPAELFYASALPMIAGAIAIAMMGQFYGHAGTASPVSQKISPHKV
ncbi:MAG TPA: MFS transporter [Micropepsaceae bacterium]|jgi:AAHS family 4-hydroxybenzoate transporter-like MFS transporter